MTSARDLEILQLCVDLAREALDAGDSPFGSVLVDATGKILRTDRNRISTGEKGDYKADATLHPEITLARWAQLNLSAEERASAAVYTSGEHCAMCSSAHAFVGLGPIVYASSTAQLVAWMEKAGVEGSRVSPLSIREVAPRIQTKGPVPELSKQIEELHRQYWLRKEKSG